MHCDAKKKDDDETDNVHVSYGEDMHVHVCRKHTF